MDIEYWILVIGAQRPVLIPKEHGAWALLYGPFLLTVAVLGRFEFPVVVLFVAISSLFLAHEPLSKLVRTSRQGVPRERALYWKRWLALYLGAALMSGFFLLWQYRLWDLIPFGLLIALLLALHLLLISQRKERLVFGEILGVVGLTSTALAAYYVIEGRWDQTCVLIWLLSLLYFAGGIFYVKMRLSRFIKTDERPQRLVHCAVYYTFLPVTLFLFIWLDLIPGVLIFAYAPNILRAFYWMFADEPALNIRKIGFTELAHTVLFIVLFVMLWKF